MGTNGIRRSVGIAMVASVTTASSRLTESDIMDNGLTHSASDDSVEPRSVRHHLLSSAARWARLGESTNAVEQDRSDHQRDGHVQELAAKREGNDGEQNPRDRCQQQQEHP